jgi:hypothetical protein
MGQNLFYENFKIASFCMLISAKAQGDVIITMDVDLQDSPRGKFRDSYTMIASHESLLQLWLKEVRYTSACR